MTELLPNATFLVKVTGMEKPILAYIGGKMRFNSINIVLGDVVELEVSPYDLTRGRIVYRER